MKRLADRLAEVARRGNLPHPQLHRSGQCHRQHSVVGRDKAVPVGLGHNRTPRTPYARIDHHQVNCPLREALPRLRQCVPRLRDPVSADLMRDIDQLRSRTNIEDHTFIAPT